MAQGISAQQLLDAIDGVAYLVDGRGIIRAIGTAAWQRFAIDNGVPRLTIDSVIGTSLFASMEGATVRDACRRLHESVCDGRRPVVAYEYRCDAPDMERRMRMSISPVIRPCGPIMALYQSQIVDEAPRLPLGLLSADRRAAAAGRHPRGEQMVLCSFCHDIEWPIGVAQPGQIWIGIAEYYRRGGTSDVEVSHGICPECIARVIEPNA